jgi:hypothetical protein
MDAKTKAKDEAYIAKHAKTPAEKAIMRRQAREGRKLILLDVLNEMIDLGEVEIVKGDEGGEDMYRLKRGRG